jgi:hypothetical protein
MLRLNAGRKNTRGSTPAIAQQSRSRRPSVARGEFYSLDNLAVNRGKTHPAGLCRGDRAFCCGEFGLHPPTRVLPAFEHDTSCTMW